jgi:hypothetical protein
MVKELEFLDQHVPVERLVVDDQDAGRRHQRLCFPRPHA